MQKVCIAFSSLKKERERRKKKEKEEIQTWCRSLVMLLPPQHLQLEISLEHQLLHRVAGLLHGQPVLQHLQPATISEFNRYKKSLTWRGCRPCRASSRAPPPRASSPPPSCPPRPWSPRPSTCSPSPAPSPSRPGSPGRVGVSGCTKWKVGLVEHKYLEKIFVVRFCIFLHIIPLPVVTVMGPGICNNIIHHDNYENPTAMCSNSGTLVLQKWTSI